MIKNKAIFWGGLSVALLGLIFWLFFEFSSQSPAESNQQKSTLYAGSAACINCHNDITGNWLTSDHANSMAAISDINTHPQFSMPYPTNEQINLNITHSFGHYPLQQYLVDIGEGKKQVAPYSWDERPKKEGGQRWFSFNAEQASQEGSRLHWKSPLQNWNGMCSDCHSTGLVKNYDPHQNQFKTEYTDVNVGCESCHGPAKAHVENMENNKPLNASFSSYALDEGQFVLSEGEDIAHWDGPARNKENMDTCFGCHSRRSPLTDNPVKEGAFLDNFVPSLLDEGAYQVDGQIEDEVFVYGSFQQSKMYQAGVHCKDCHTPHSEKVKAPTGEDNSLCQSCHSVETYSPENHSKHPSESAGAACVNCHMPETTYMGVDKRRDHSFKIPRPDHSIKFNVKNSCTTCHSDQTNTWAKNAITKWFGPTRPSDLYTEINFEARKGNPAIEAKLIKFAQDDAVPAIQRATLLTLWPQIANPDNLKAIASLVNHHEPLIRIGAIRALNVLSPHERKGLIEGALLDPVAAVRHEATISLLSLPDEKIPNFSANKEELKTAYEISSWRGEGRSNLAGFYIDINDHKMAETQYLKGIEIDPSFMGNYLNLADFYRRGNRDGAAQNILTKGLAVQNDQPDLLHARGLGFIRAKDYKNGIVDLEKSARLNPDNPRYAYVYAVALNSSGKSGKAWYVLKRSVKKHPYYFNMLQMMLSMALNENNRVKTKEACVLLKPFKERSPDAQRVC